MGLTVQLHDVVSRYVADRYLKEVREGFEIVKHTPRY